jgi:hypothetical protein
MKAKQVVNDERVFRRQGILRHRQIHQEQANTARKQADDLVLPLLLVMRI